MTSKQYTKWLKLQFEYEYCEECGGDWVHHTACGGPFANPFARCNFPPSQETGWEYHPVIKAYRKLMEHKREVSQMTHTQARAMACDCDTRAQWDDEEG